MPNELILKAIDAAGFDAATLTDDNGSWVLTMTRSLPRSVDQVWPWLTEPERLAQWSPIVPNRSLISRGAAQTRENPGDDWVDAEVLEVDPPHELIHRWGDHSMRWTLTPAEEGCVLTLEQRFAEAEAGPLMAGGWHVCLAVLTVNVEDHAVDRVVGEAADEYDWQRLHDRYAEQWAPTTADSSKGAS
ncbi:SRPBCC domain-containing protein [Microlunatus speluncae]|uniref:SRPBCC domain-containing protein n=1 Tax=Microlunatus speluncae TaxID=2594267 RepID=UPI001C2CE054|nr:SRPBCC domain-containing protein [Microlunatus speluncae]